MANIKVVVPDVATPYEFPLGMNVEEIQDVLLNVGVITDANPYTVSADGNTVTFSRPQTGDKGQL